MRFRLPFITLLLVAASPTWAHHGSAGFDENKPVHLVGRVRSVDWSNPHVVIHLDVAAPNAQLATWLINTDPPNAAKRKGFPEGAFAVGTELTVDGYQAIDGSNHVNGTKIVFPDGRTIISPDCFDNGPYCYQRADGPIRVQ